MKTQIAAYYFPNYHPDRRNAAVYGPGWTEWELMKQATPRFSGHEQPRIPVWGYEDEADPKVMARKIEAAKSHGIDFFIFDWYYYNDGPFLERALEEGFLNATNNDRLKFCCMWANHDWRRIHPAGLRDSKKVLYPGHVTPETFKKISRIFIERYFPHPSHFRINHCPMFSLYDLTSLVKTFGSVGATRQALDEFRQSAVDAGFPGIHLNAIIYTYSVLPGETEPPEAAKLISNLGFDSVTSYVWLHHVPLMSPVCEYESVMESYFEQWQIYAAEMPVPYFPNVTVGWDSTPRTVQHESWDPGAGYPYCPVITGNTPNLFRQALNRTKKTLKKYDIPQIITINSWNEWTEGSYLEPDQIHGMKYLEAIRAEMLSEN